MIPTGQNNGANNTTGNDTTIVKNAPSIHLEFVSPGIEIPGTIQISFGFGYWCFMQWNAYRTIAKIAPIIQIQLIVAPIKIYMSIGFIYN